MRILKNTRHGAAMTLCIAHAPMQEDCLLQIASASSPSSTVQLALSSSAAGSTRCLVGKIGTAALLPLTVKDPAGRTPTRSAPQAPPGEPPLSPRYADATSPRSL
jgi:hypothetical protein